MKDETGGWNDCWLMKMKTQESWKSRFVMNVAFFSHDGNIRMYQWHSMQKREVGEWRRAFPSAVAKYSSVRRLLIHRSPKASFDPDCSGATHILTSTFWCDVCERWNNAKVNSGIGNRGTFSIGSTPTKILHP